MPLIVLAGADYGSGSSRDWAAKGTLLLGVKAVLATSFERIHRANLIGMGVLPLQFMPGQSAQSLGLTGEETYSITGLAGVNPLPRQVTVRVDADGRAPELALDAGLSRAVREVFVRLYEKGLIYRGEYMVNWCPDCQTAISDLETAHTDVQGSLWHIRYPVNGMPGRYLTVATTRPETMLGDTAVAVNAKDERYFDVHGKTVQLPLMDREIPIILDDLADPAFGTGVVKVTPAHDLNDFEAGKRHNLPKIQVIDNRALMTEAAGPYAGLDRFEARHRVVADLEKIGALVKVEPYQLSLGTCQRSKTPIEPLISTQWFVKTKPLAEKAIEVVENGQIQFVPPNWVKTYNEWMYNIRDWCISRQLWWGHRIPAWYCGECREISVSRETVTDLPALRIGEPDPGHRRARHLVFQRTLALFHPGLARPDRPTWRASTRHRS